MSSSGSSSRTYSRKEPRLYATVEELYKKSQPSYANAGGFLVDDEDEGGSSNRNRRKGNPEDEDDEASYSKKEEAHDGDGDGEGYRCLECGRSFLDSYLTKYFDHPVCDECKDLDEKHALITRTDAKKEFLLKDCDLISRQPALRFVSRKNPHNPRWGDMKLYLRLQVEKRAAEVHSSIDNLEETKKAREEKRVEQRQKRFHKKIVELRKTVRSDLYHKGVEIHQHDYGEEHHDSDADKYYRKCKVCSHKDVYEKL